MDIRSTTRSHGKIGWNINANVDFDTLSKPVRLVKRESQATKQGVLWPILLWKWTRRDLIYNNFSTEPSTKFGRGVSNAETATMYRSNYVTDHRRHETPGTTQALRRDIRDISTKKKIDVSSTSRVRGDKVQLRRMPNAVAMKPNSIVHDSQKSDRSLDRRSELPIGYSVMPTSIATQDFGRRKDRNARIAMFNGGHKNVVKLRRLEQIPGVMINRGGQRQDTRTRCTGLKECSKTAGNWERA